MYYLGQGFGLLGIACNVLAPALKKKAHMLLTLLFLNLFNLLNFLLIGHRGSAVWLYVVAMVQSAVTLFRVRRDSPTAPWETALFSALYLVLGGVGIVSALGFPPPLNGSFFLELLPVLGALLSMTTIFVRSEQVTRVFVLLTSLVWMVYSAVVGATAFFSDGACAVVTVIALIRYRKRV